MHFYISSKAPLFLFLLFCLVNPAAAQVAKLPTWVKNLPLLQWHAIPNTKLSDIAPRPTPLGNNGPVSKITAWNGATLKREGSVYLLGAAGGHADYAGNEVNALKLNTETPKWVELSPPTTNSQLINRSQYYLDLKPSATHTYYGTQFIDARNRMIVVASPGMDFGALPIPPTDWAYANLSSYSFSFNLATNTWDKPEYFASYPGGGDYTAALVVKHPVTEDIYYSRSYGGSAWWRWTQRTNTWSKLSDATRAPWYVGAAIDPLSNQMLLVGSAGDDIPAEVRGLTGQRISVTFHGLGPDALRLSGYTGVVYDEANKVFLVVYNNPVTSKISILRVNPKTWFVDRLPVTGLLPANRQNGIHNSVQYVPELGGIVIANSYTDNVMFMRTSAGATLLPLTFPSEVPAPPQRRALPAP